MKLKDIQKRREEVQKLMLEGKINLVNSGYYKDLLDIEAQLFIIEDFLSSHNEVYNNRKGKKQ